MINPVPIQLNLNNLRDVFSRISDLEAFVFFGTLLGYQREGNIIVSDDDVDIYINARNYTNLLDALSESDFEVKTMPHKKWYHWSRTPLIVQAMRVQNGTESFVDFYLYNDEAFDYLEEKWNFQGKWRDVKTAIHIPKNLIFPLLEVKMQGINIRIPAKSQEVCAFLYGPGWQTPALKGEDYVMEIIDHVPKFCEKF